MPAIYRKRTNFLRYFPYKKSTSSSFLPTFLKSNRKFLFKLCKRLFPHRDLINSKVMSSEALRYIFNTSQNTMKIDVEIAIAFYFCLDCISLIEYFFMSSTKVRFYIEKRKKYDLAFSKFFLQKENYIQQYINYLSHAFEILICAIDRNGDSLRDVHLILEPYFLDRLDEFMNFVTSRVPLYFMTFSSEDSEVNNLTQSFNFTL